MGGRIFVKYQFDTRLRRQGAMLRPVPISLLLLNTECRTATVKNVRVIVYHLCDGDLIFMTIYLSVC